MSDQSEETEGGLWEGGDEETFERCQTLLRTVSDGMYRLDIDGRFVAIDDGLIEMTGYTRGDLLGESVSELLDESAVARIEDVIRNRRENGADDTPFDVAITTADGDRIPCELYLNRLLDGDEFEGTVGAVREISEQKEYQRKLEESERRYRTLVQNFPNGAVTLVDEDIKYQTVGGNPLDVIDLTAEEVEGEPVRDVVPPELAAELVPCYEAAFRGESSAFQEESGHKVYQFQVVPVRDGEGDVFAALGMSQDITEREEAQRRLAESERRYRTLVENFPNGSVGLFNEDLEYTALGGQLLDTLGVAPDDRIGHSIQELHPDGLLEQIEPHFRSALEGESNVFEIEYRDQYLSVYTLPVSDAGDETYSGMVVVQDVTDRKAVEQDLRESEARFRMLAENLDEIVWMTTPDAEEFIYVNPAFEEVWEQDRTQLYDDPLSFLDRVHEEDRERIRKRFTALPEADFDEEYRVVRPDGEIRWIHSRGTSVVDGGMARIVGIGQDITERKEQKRELERALDLLERTERVADVGGWEIDTESMDVFWTDHTFDLLEVDADEEPPLDTALDMYHDEGQSALEDAIETALESNESFDVEARIRTGDGGMRWLRLQGVPETIDGDVVSLRGAAQDITERKHREQRLEESEARFRLLAENLEEMVWISDTETREILYLNPAYEDIWGRDRTSLYDDPTTFLESVHPDDRERVEQAYATVPDERFDEEYRVIQPDGDVRWLSVRAESVRSEGRERVVGIAEDITDRKEHERALEESERRYRTLAENFPNGAVGLYNEDLEYTAVGGQLLEATGVEPADRIGSSVYEIYPDELIEEIEPYFHAALDGEANSFETEFHNRNLLAHTLPVRNADDEVFAGMLVVQDVTERREYERRLEESNERLEQFAYAASHDLQEPLRMVSSYLQLVESRYADQLDEDGREFIEFAVDGADRMRDMIEGLLQYSRVDTRGNPFEAVDLNEVVADVRQDLQVKIQDTNAEITAEDLPRVYGDGSQLKQVFQNLLDNAIEYSGDKPPHVHVGAEKNDDQWIISVRDEGLGIDPEDAERVFEVFQSLHGGGDSGTGIGLALVERIVERHDGEIWIDSEPGAGATFSFILPAADEVDE
ncbi:PAS domain S-box protein [Halosimplex sp. TS25]|uniref:PAS domain S-box protein n=1 Tax=Halosimplex rarum TaxID=3396619 RepID=UPI0039EB38B5